MVKRRGEREYTHEQDAWLELPLLISESLANRLLAALPEVIAAQASTPTTPDFQIRRLSGGYNNDVYWVILDGEAYIYKFYVNDDRRRAKREYDALVLAHQLGYDIAPIPCLVDESLTISPHPLVIYHALHGEPVGFRSLSDSEFYALLQAYQKVYRINSERCNAPLLPAVGQPFGFKPYFNDIWEQLGVYLTYCMQFEANPAAAPGWCKTDVRSLLRQAVEDFAYEIVQNYLEVDQENLLLSLCRSDPNLNNVILSAGGVMRFVDWEYSGWGDPAFDIAQLFHHPRTELITQAQWDAFVRRYQPPRDDDTFSQRLWVYDRLTAVWWCVRLARRLVEQATASGVQRLAVEQPATLDEFESRLRRRLQNLQFLAGVFEGE